MHYYELPVEQQWKSTSDVIKGLVTEPILNYRNMHDASYIQKNTFNIVITANNNSITMTQNNMMRLFTSDIDESKAEDKAYFIKLKIVMSKQVVQKAFYQMMMNRFNSDKVNKWNEDEIPETKTKILKIIEALPTFYMLKNNIS